MRTHLPSLEDSFTSWRTRFTLPTICLIFCPHADVFGQLKHARSRLLDRYYTEHCTETTQPVIFNISTCIVCNNFIYLFILFAIILTYFMFMAYVGAACVWRCLRACVWVSLEYEWMMIIPSFIMFVVFTKLDCLVKCNWAWLGKVRTVQLHYKE